MHTVRWEHDEEFTRVTHEITPKEAKLVGLNCRKHYIFTVASSSCATFRFEICEATTILLRIIRVGCTFRFIPRTMPICKIFCSTVPSLSNATIFHGKYDARKLIQKSSTTNNCFESRQQERIERKIVWEINRIGRYKPNVQEAGSRLSPVLVNIFSAVQHSNFYIVKDRQLRKPIVGEWNFRTVKFHLYTETHTNKSTKIFGYVRWTHDNILSWFTNMWLAYFYQIFSPRFRRRCDWINSNPLGVTSLTN